MKVFIVILVLSVSLGAQSKVESDIKAIKAYVIKLNKRVKELENKVKELEGRLAPQAPVANVEEPPAQENAAPVNPQFGQGANKAALLAIEVPGVFNNRIVREYMAKINAATQGQRSYGSSDYQCYLIRQVPMQYADQLVLLADYNVKIYLGYALPDMVRDSDRNFVFKYLMQIPELAKAIQVRQEWHAAAWPLLVRGMMSADYLPDSWLSHVALKNKIDGNKALLKYFERRGSLHTLKYLKQTSLRATEIQKAAQRLWRTKKHSQHEALYASLVGVSFGEIDALDLVIKTIKNPGSNTYVAREGRSILGRMVDTDDEILAWYEANRNRIRYDATSQKYLVR